MSTVTVSTVIVTHNSKATLPSCLASLATATSTIDHELVVVDNNSVEDPTDLIATYFPQATILKNDRNLGFGRACNVAARSATGEYLLFLNPDVVLDPQAIGYLLRVAQSGLRVGAVGGRLRHSDGSFQATCRRLPTLYNMIFSRGSVFSRLARDGQRYTLGDFSEVTTVPALAATLLLIRRGLFQRMLGFDERFYMYMEDTDLCARLVRRGYTNQFVPAAGAVHDWGTGSDAGRVRRAWLHHNSVWRYFLKHLPNGFSLIVLPLLLAINFLLVVATGRSPSRADQQTPGGAN